MNKKTRIAVFIDGYRFDLINRYYTFKHRQDGYLFQKEINFDGLDAYILKKTAEAIEVSEKNCSIIGKHLYQGVPAGLDATPEQSKEVSDYSARLKKHNITPHFESLWKDEKGHTKEKMVDVDLVCGVLEMAFKKEFDVLVLIASDADFVPMVKLLTKLTVVSVLFFWDLPEYEIDGEKRKQKTSDLLIQSVTHRFDMTYIADSRGNGELEKNIFSRPKFPKAFQRMDIDKPKRPTQDKVEQLGADNIQSLVMNFEPRVLTEDELRKTWESTVISLHPKGYGGFIKGPVGFMDSSLNNFQFSTRDIGDRQITDFEIGKKIHFKLQPDPKRSEQLGHPLYRAYDIVLCDPPVSSAQLEQSEPKAPKPDTAPSLSATQENDGLPIPPGQPIPPEPEKAPIEDLSKEPDMVKQKIDSPKEEVNGHLDEADKEVIRQRPVAALGRVGGRYVGPRPMAEAAENSQRPMAVLIKRPNVDSTNDSEMGERRKCIVVKKPPSVSFAQRPVAVAGRVVQRVHLDSTDDPEM